MRKEWRRGRLERRNEEWKRDGGNEQRVGDGETENGERVEEMEERKVRDRGRARAKEIEERERWKREGAVSDSFKWCY